MNILYVTFNFKVGGIERLLVDIVNTLVKDSNNTVYLCVINDEYDKYLLKQVDKDVNIILLNRPVGGKKIKYVIRYTNIIIKNKIDVIHCQMENAVKFSILSKIIKPKLKIFTTVHDTNIFSNLKITELMVDKIICNKIIAISDIVKNEILSRGIAENKVVRIYNAIDIKKFSNCNVRKEFNKDKIIIGNVSRLIPEKKGQDILIKAIAKIKEKYPNILCIFAGDTPFDQPNNLNELKKTCKLLKVENNIRFLGNVEDVPKFLDNIDIFVLPSRYEGFGISLIEAMEKGVPCIASDIDGPKEIIKDNKYGLLFKDGNEIDLAEKLEYRINNIKFNRNLIEEYINKNFEINNMVGKLINLYNA